MKLCQSLPIFCNTSPQVVELSLFLFSVYVKPQVVECMYALDDSAEDYSELNRGCLSEAVDWLEEKEEAMMWTSVAALVVTAANAAVAVGAGMRAAG